MIHAGLNKLHFYYKTVKRKISISYFQLFFLSCLSKSKTCKTLAGRAKPRPRLCSHASLGLGLALLITKLWRSICKSHLSRQSKEFKDSANFLY